MDLDGLRRILISENVFDRQALEADLFAHNAVGDTLLHSAVYHQLPLVIAQLIQQGAPLEARGDFGFTALHAAAFRGYAQIASLLLSAGADASAVSDFGETPLDLARQCRAEDVVRLLGGEG